MIAKEPVYKQISKFKPAVLRLKIYQVSHLGGWVVY